MRGLLVPVLVASAALGFIVWAVCEYAVRVLAPVGGAA